MKHFLIKSVSVLEGTKSCLSQLRLSLRLRTTEMGSYLILGHRTHVCQVGCLSGQELGAAGTPGTSHLGKFMFPCSLRCVQTSIHSLLQITRRAPIWCKGLGWAVGTQKWMQSILALQTLTAKSRCPQLHWVSLKGPSNRLMGAGLGVGGDTVT